jgi:hypothetical protein
MMKPSVAQNFKTYEAIDPEIIVRYLLANGWRCIYEEELQRAGVQWFHHPVAPRWKGKDLETNCMIPDALMYLFADNDLRTIVGGGTVIRIAPKRFADYGRCNVAALHDLEIHEIRWIGLIIEDVQALQNSA